MTEELSEKLNNGEMPNDWYLIPETRSDLVRIIKERNEGWLIAKDAPNGVDFSFGRSESGKFVIISGDSEQYFGSAEEAVSFGVIGKDPLWPALKGKRIVQNDAPTPFPDEP